MADQIPNPNNPGSATQTEQSIMIVIEHRPEIVLLDDGKRDALFAFIEAEVEAFEPDVTTAKGRDAIKALAFKITRTKTAVESARLRLTEEWREKIKAVNAGGTPIKEKLEALAKSARAPLTAWEEAEEKREAECKAALERLRQAAIVPIDATADSLRARITEVEAEPMAEDHWLGMLTLAETAKATALEALTAALALVEQKERDAAELTRLREEAAERERLDAERREREEWERSEQERQAREAKEAQELEERRARQAEEAEEAAEREAERTRLATEQAATAAAETARQEEAQRAEQQAAEQQRAHEAELRAANERAAEIERQAEQQRLAREVEDQRRADAEKAAADERARLEADQARRRQVKADAKDAIISCGADEETAKKIVLAILAGEIPRVILDFSAEPPGVKKPASPAPGVGQDAGSTPQGAMI